MNIQESSAFCSQNSGPTVGQGSQSKFLIVLFGLIVSGIIVRLVHLQIFEGVRYKELALSNRIRVIPKPPERGSIFDRNGKILATTRNSRSLYVWSMAHKKPSWKIVGPRLSKILNIPQEELEAKIKASSVGSTEEIRLLRNLSIAQTTAIEEYQNELPGVEIHLEGVRVYPHQKELAHAIGYTRELTAEQLKDKRKQGYLLGDVIGQMGVERAFERLLRGKWGDQQIEVDRRGRLLRVLAQRYAQPGQDIHLTIDLDIQKAAEKALGNRNGAIVVMNPNNGEILAMVSYPGYDPNIFSPEKLSEKDWRSLQSQENPLVNRALSAFPPASTFKIVTTAAGLESGKYSPATVLPTYSSLTFGGIRFGEWNHAGFGPLGWTGAMAMSSDTFFYQIGAKIGGDTLIGWTRKFGFGEKTGFELEAEESSGLVPDESWTRKTFNTPWSVGHTVNMSIGQGALLATPLQVAVMFAASANGGYRVRPHLLHTTQLAQSDRKSLGLKPETLKIIHNGLRRVISQGTGNKLNVSKLPPIAGKTGTAEAWRGKTKENHTWFGGYAPANNPEILVVAFTEHSGGAGGTIAAPMALQIMHNYFDGKVARTINSSKALALRID